MTVVYNNKHGSIVTNNLTLLHEDLILCYTQLDKNRHFAEIFAFTQNCNWLDVVEVTFHTGEETGM